MIRKNPLLTMSDLVGADVALDEYGPIPKEQLIEKSLANPKAPGALTIGKVDNITKARIRQTLSNVVALEIPHIQSALRELQSDSPKAYLETVMSFMEFSLPKLKAMELDVSDNRESAKAMTLEELQRAMGESVVSTQ